eukprot:7236310-Ditylum_brightwellii.AAC.1
MQGNITTWFQGPVQSLAHGKRARAQSATQSRVEENMQEAGGGNLVDMEAYSTGYFTVMSKVPCKIRPTLHETEEGTAGFFRGIHQ